MSHHVYLLVHTIEPRFKIGHSFNIKARMEQLGLKEVDTKRSRGYELASRGLAQLLERLLHEVARPYRIPSTEIPRSGSLRGGETEWFQVSCLDQVTSFLQQNRDYIAWKEIDLSRLLETDPSAKMRRSRVTKLKRLEAWRLNMVVLVQKRMVVIEELLIAMYAQVNRAVLLPRYKGALKDYRPMICTARVEAHDYLKQITQELSLYGGIQTEFLSTNLFSDIAFAENEDKTFVVFCIDVNWMKERQHPIEAYDIPFNALRNLTLGIEGWDWQLSTDGYHWAADLLYKLHRNNSTKKFQVDPFR